MCEIQNNKIIHYVIMHDTILLSEKNRVYLAKMGNANGNGHNASMSDDPSVYNVTISALSKAK